MTSKPSVLSPLEGMKFDAGPFSIRARVLGAQTNRGFELYELALGPATIDSGPRLSKTWP